MFEPEDFDRLFYDVDQELISAFKGRLCRTYNPERYRLVEIEDWKAKQLEVRISYKKELIEEHKRKIKFYSELVRVNLDALHNLEKELKELE